MPLFRVGRHGERTIRAWLIVGFTVVALGACSTAAPTSSPQVSATARPPTAAPIPSVAATPTPSPTGPVEYVPADIDASGSQPVTAALLAFIQSVPEGTTISFPAGGSFRLDGALRIVSRRHVTLDGNGSTLIAGPGTSEQNALIWLDAAARGNQGITIRNFKLVGANLNPGVYAEGREGAHGIIVDGGQDIEVTGVTVSKVWGDCFYVGSWADAVRIHDSTCESAGRNGVTITAGRNVTVEAVSFPRSGYSTFDIEPNTSSEGAEDVVFQHNTVGTWTNTFLSAVGAVGSTVDGVTATGNTVTGGTLLTVIDLPRRRNVSFTDNTAQVSGHGPILRFAHIDGLTVTGNVQPLTSGSLADISDSTNVLYP